MADRVLVVDDEEGIRAFLREALASEGLAVTEAADGQAALDLLAHRSWPGNVRELSNALERAAILTDGDVIEPSALLLGTPASEPVAEGLDGTLKDIEARAIRRALTATGGHRRRAAERLGLGLRTLYEKLKAYGIE